MAIKSQEYKLRVIILNFKTQSTVILYNYQRWGAFYNSYREGGKTRENHFPEENNVALIQRRNLKALTGSEFVVPFAQ
ncbi:MAG: hypothetical protein ACPGLR_05545, partial [Flavobacteriaceae bacterium]